MWFYILNSITNEYEIQFQKNWNDLIFHVKTCKLFTYLQLCMSESV